jgi:4-aminobutyrate aminotransferase
MMFESGEEYILDQEKLGRFEKMGRIESPENNLAADFDFFKEIGLIDIVGPKAREIIEQDCNIVSACAARPYPLVVDRAKGSIITDVDGREYLDFVAGIAVMNAGHSNPEVNAAIYAQLEKMTHCGYGFFCRAACETCKKVDRAFSLFESLLLQQRDRSCRSCNQARVLENKAAKPYFIL